jgi:uncharacterized protein YndB with AHSA1/START domain
MTPAQTFHQFTQALDQWWPPAGRGPGAPRAFIEPRVGGRWYERDSKGLVRLWGQVLAWTPPQGLVLAWQVGANGEFDPALRTELEVVIAPVSATASLVSLEHRHFEGHGAAAVAQEALLASAVDWVGILERFARHCAGGLRHA